MGSPTGTAAIRAVLQAKPNVAGLCGRRVRAVPPLFLGSPAALPAAQPAAISTATAAAMGAARGGLRFPNGVTEMENSTQNAQLRACGTARRRRQPGRAAAGLRAATKRTQAALIHRRGAHVASVIAVLRPWARRSASARVSERIAPAQRADIRNGRRGADAEAGKPPRAHGCQRRAAPLPAPLPRGSAPSRRSPARRRPQRSSPAERSPLRPCAARRRPGGPAARRRGAVTAALPMAAPPPVGGQRHGCARREAAAPGRFASPGKAVRAAAGGSCAGC